MSAVRVRRYDQATNWLSITPNGATGCLSCSSTNAIPSGTYDSNGSPACLAAAPTMGMTQIASCISRRALPASPVALTSRSSLASRECRRLSGSAAGYAHCRTQVRKSRGSNKDIVNRPHTPWGSPGGSLQGKADKRTRSKRHLNGTSAFERHSGQKVSSVSP